MKFLYPEFLYGLSALSIPIIIHLFNFRKARKVYFSSTRFLKQVREETSQKLKLKHFLILAARLLFIFFIVMAFAQPYLPSEDRNPKSENVLIYLDNSPSMSNRVPGGMTGLEQGLQYIDELQELYPTNTNYVLLTNDFSSYSNTFKSKDQLTDLITEIRMSNVTRTLQESYSRLKAVKSYNNRSSDVYIISDFQKSTIGDLDHISFDSTDQVILAPVVFERASNVYVDTVFLDNPSLSGVEENNLHILLKNQGKEDKNGLLLKLFVNGIQSANTSFDIEAGGKVALSFPVSFRLKKENHCRITFEDYPVLFDNEFYFTLKKGDPVRVFEVKSTEEVSPFEQVFGNEDLYNFVSNKITNVDYSLLNRSDLLVLHKLGSVDQNLSSAILEFLDQNGVVVIDPPPGTPDIAGIRSIIGQPLTAVDSSGMEDLAPPDLNNPFYSNVFDESDETFDMPSARVTLRWEGDRNTLLSLRNGRKFLSEFRARGNVFLFASPLDETYTTLHRHAIFVPTMYKIASGARDADGRLYYSINEDIVQLKMDSLDRSEIYKMTGEGQELIPGQRIAGNTLVLEIPKNIINPGIYTLIAGEIKKGSLAFNRENEESLIAQYTPPELQTLLASGERIALFDAGNPDTFAQAVKNKKFGVPLWKYAVILALIFLLAEVLLIRFL